MAPLIIGRPDQKGSTGQDNRRFVEGVLRIVRTGAPWRDLPAVFGERNTVFRRFSRWSDKGVWRRIVDAMSDDPDFEYLILDHQHAAGAKEGGLTIRPFPWLFSLRCAADAAWVSGGSRRHRSMIAGAILRLRFQCSCGSATWAVRDRGMAHGAGSKAGNSYVLKWYMQ
jgi:putative transposase